jgi:TPR repeat protein
LITRQHLKSEVPALRMASFEEKVDALRRLRDRKLLRQQESAIEEAVAKSAGPLRCHDTADEESSPSSTEGTARSMEADAFFCMGHCHERGLNECDGGVEEAAGLYLLAAELGHTVAQWRLAELWETGRGVAKNESEAAYFYRQAAEAGFSHAQSGLALLLEDGRGVTRDDAEAFQWHMAAAHQGHALSQYCAARCLLDGRGCERDVSAAKHWLGLSAAAGFPVAEELLEKVKLQELVTRRACKLDQIADERVQDGSAEEPSSTGSDASNYTSRIQAVQETRQDRVEEDASLLNLATRVAALLRDVDDDEEAAALLDILVGDDGSSDGDDSPRFVCGKEFDT